ncbi:sulfate ABC transporter substrate-binding protein [Planctomicrobium sp. SH668]|uniref:sulfate ABC transporter substrate-binding protein n=1 Tax=Planctomicrobium sp. SH668 TaxID=3448126 RepID=UPI003F5C6B87
MLSQSTRKSGWSFLVGTALLLGGVATFLPLSGCSQQTTDYELLNVSYDPTRELWKDLNAAFVPKFEEKHGKTIKINQSHAGSGPQARAVIEGLPADVVTLALSSDVDAISRSEVIAEKWSERLPHNSVPYTSSIVFVVRKGNPQGIKDWPDLAKPEVQVIVPSPKTSGNGKLAFMALWGSVVLNGGTEDEAREFVKKIYKNTPVLDTGARGATVSFAERGLGNVHLTWESEAHLEIAQSNGDLELVFPSSSILAEPPVTVVDKVVDSRKTREIAEEYLQFLYTPEAQQIIANHYFRPQDTTVLEANRDRFPEIKLYPVTAISPGGLGEAQKRFFDDRGEFDQIYESSGK